MTETIQRTGAGTILSGVETLVRLLVLRQQLDEREGLSTATMVSGYPGSPLGGFDLALESLGEVLAAHRIIHRPGLNEELAAATVWGSQMGAVTGYDGVDGDPSSDVTVLQQSRLRRAVIKDGTFAYVNPELYP